jgi:hypothetical protein
LKAKVVSSPGPWSKKVLEMTTSELQESKSRRSGRQKALHRGFKGSPCFNKNYLGCTMEPPSFSPSLIKNLGESFCKINPEKLTEKELNKKKLPSAAAPGGKKQQHKKKDKDYNDDQAKNAKKKSKK